MYKPDSPEQKIAKGEHILETATQFLRDNGLDALSMNKLASACNVAKGTLYLYFKTREEIMAALYLSVFWNWLNALPQDVAECDTYDNFCRAYCASLERDPLLVPLMCDAQNRIQHNIPIETFVEFKRSQSQGLEKLAQVFAQNLNLDDTQASQTVWAFHVATLGAANFIKPSAFAQNSLPPDTHGLTFGLGFSSMFLNTVTQLKI